MTFCYIAQMDEQRSWLRRARRILSVWLLTCIICNLDQNVMQVPRFNHICYSSGYSNQVGPTWCRGERVWVEPVLAESSSSFSSSSSFPPTSASSYSLPSTLAADNGASCRKCSYPSSWYLLPCILVFLKLNSFLSMFPPQCRKGEEDLLSQGWSHEGGLSFPTWTTRRRRKSGSHRCRARRHWNLQGKS
jgi:hypothetical protein